MDDYQKARQKEREELNTLAQGIASYLVWEALPIEEGSNRAYITNGTAMFGITIDAYGNRNRVEIYGIYPQYIQRENSNQGYPLSGEDPPHITCALARGAEAVAKDIERKFLTKFIACHNLAVERIAQSEARLDAEEAVMFRLAGILEAELKHGEIRFSHNDIWGTISSVSKDAVTFEIRRVPIALAVKICDLLREPASA